MRQQWIGRAPIDEKKNKRLLPPPPQHSMYLDLFLVHIRGETRNHDLLSDGLSRGRGHAGRSALGVWDSSGIPLARSRRVIVVVAARISRT